MWTETGRGREPWDSGASVNDTCHTGLESHGRAPEGIKGGVTTMEDEKGPDVGLYVVVLFRSCCSRSCGAATVLSFC